MEKNTKKNNLHEKKITLTKSIRDTIMYAIWKEGVTVRNNYVCRLCKIETVKGLKYSPLDIKTFVSFIGGVKKFLKINNIKTFEEAMKTESLWSLDNGITLCRKCWYKNKE